MKTCNWCNETKDYSSFTKHKGSKDGHVNQCKSCLAAKAKRLRAKDLDKFREVERKSKAKNYEKNRGRQLAYKKLYYQENREVINRRQKKYSLLRHHRLKQATPPWISDAHIKEIEDIYWLRDDLRVVTGEVYEVDHIVPLQGNNVCGLHVPWNLQILSQSENRAKRNNYE